MKGFARMTKLSNVGGRADYISNPKRQEEILAKSESVDWKPYHEYEQKHQMSYQSNNEGRELIIALPNEWAKLPPERLQANAQRLAEKAIGKSTDMQWAVHWNKARTNLHLHVVFSERQKEKEPKRWDRDVYLREDGKVARKKSERATNPDGTYKPPVHKKGELKDGFTAKDPKYKDYKWLKDTKNELVYELRRMGAIMEYKNVLHEFHEGKGSDSATIKLKNEIIRENNARIYTLAGKPGMDFINASREMKHWLKQKEIPVLYHDGEKVCVEHFKDPAEAKELMEHTSMTPEIPEKAEVELPEPVPTQVGPLVPEEPRAEIGRENTSLIGAIMDIKEKEQAVQQIEKGFYRKDEPIDQKVIDKPARSRETVGKLIEAHKTFHETDERLRTEYPRPVPPKKSIFTSKKAKEQYKQDMAVWEEKTADLRAVCRQAYEDCDRYFKEIKENEYVLPHELKVGYRGGGYTTGTPEINPHNMSEQDIKQVQRFAEARIQSHYQPWANAEKEREQKQMSLVTAKEALRASRERYNELKKDLPEETIRKAEKAVESQIKAKSMQKSKGISRGSGPER